MKTCQDTQWAFDRRGMLQRSACGFGALALTVLKAQWSAAEERKGYASPLASKPPHFAAKAKRVIFLFMEGGPSHLDTFDWKPDLVRAAKSNRRLLAPVFDFRPHGKSGLTLSDVMPHLARRADDLCLLNGSQTKNPGHQQAIIALHTGNETFVRPSLGAWTVYGLGTLSEDLPGFITIDPISNQGGAQNYGSAFLPATFQGTALSGGSRGVPNIANRHLTEGDQRRQLDFVQKLNRRALDQSPDNPELEGMIESYELAFKMQTSVPKTLDLEGEPKHIHELYGLDDVATSRFGAACLMARRLAEKGVRFIQLTSNGWDHHNAIRDGLSGRWGAIDKPIAGLIADLAQRGLLKDTLIVWGGEFGRGPYNDKQNGGAGRGHNAKGFTVWMAGGGVKGGFAHGKTDELGERAVEGVVGTHDLHATILHLLGLDHERLTFRYSGRDFRLTDTAGKVAKEILA